MGKIYNISLTDDFLESIAAFVLQKIKEINQNKEKIKYIRIFFPNKLSCIEFRKKISKYDFGEYNLYVYSISDEISIDEQQIVSVVLQVTAKNKNFKDLPIDTLYSLSASLTNLIKELIYCDIQHIVSDYTVPEKLQEYWDYYQKIVKDVVNNPEMQEIIKNYKKKFQIFLDSIIDSPVIVAGIRDSNHYLFKFLQKIYEFEKGILIFRGFESQDSQNYIFYKNLIDRLKVENNVICYWDSIKDKKVPRETLKNLKITHRKLKNPKVQLSEFRNISDEAFAVALAVRQALQNQQSVLVLSNDSILTEKIIFELNRWDIKVNLPDSENIILSQYRIIFSMLVDVLDKKFSTISAISWLKMFPNIREIIMEFELFLRKRQLISSTFFEAFDTWLKSIGSEDLKYKEVCNIVYDIKTIYFDKFQQVTTTTFNEWIRICAEFLRFVDKNIEAEFLKVLKSLENKFINLHLLTFEEFGIFLKKHIINKYSLTSYIFQSNIILGTITEAQLLTAERIIITGANSEYWEITDENDAWMTKYLLSAFRKNYFKERNEFIQCILESLLCKTEVLITCSLTIMGEQRQSVKFLEKLVGNIEISKCEWLESLLMILKKSQNFHKIIFEAPNPPLEYRPPKISATGVNLLKNNPYGFYAKNILKLSELSRINELKNIKGNYIHKVLEKFVKNSNDKNDLTELTKTSEKILQEMRLSVSDFGLWFFRIPKVLSFVIQNLNNNFKYYSEIKGKIDLQLTEHYMLTIESRADRIDINSNEMASIIDYKTGIVPSIRQVKNFEAPQLAVEAIIYSKNGFSIKNLKLESICFWKLNEKESGGRIVYVTKTQEETEQLIQFAYAELEKLMKEYNVDCRSYDFNLKYKYDEHYAHLARKKEWSDA